MARWENEDVSGMGIPEPIRSEVKYLNKEGRNCNDERYAYTKTISTAMPDKTTFTKHYIRFNRGEFVDPHSVDIMFKSKTPEFKKVSEACYNLYKKYLITKNRLYFTRSRRLYMEN
jgi:hypothetical protein